MSDEYPQHFFAPYPFAVTDAALRAFLDEYGTEMKFRARWFQTSAGSARHTITSRGGSLGEFHTRATADQTTYIRVIAANPLPTYAPWLLAKFTFWVHTEILKLRALEANQIAPSPPGSPPQLPPTAPKESSTNEPPDRDAPIHDWLDWRDAQKQRGRNISLPYIARQSRHPLSTLKKHSAARNQRGTKEEPL
jgi:hypothetical protein